MSEPDDYDVQECVKDQNGNIQIMNIKPKLDGAQIKQYDISRIKMANKIIKDREFADDKVIKKMLEYFKKAS